MHFKPGVVALLLLLSGCESPPPNKKGAAKPNVEFRLAETSPSEGLVETSAPGWRQPIYLHKEAELTYADLLEVTAGVVEGEHMVSIIFTRRGAEKMRRLSDLHRGKILVILADGEIVLASPIKESMNERVVISGVGLTAADANRIAKRLRGW